MEALQDFDLEVCQADLQASKISKNLRADQPVFETDATAGLQPFGRPGWATNPDGHGPVRTGIQSFPVWRRAKRMKIGAADAQYYPEAVRFSPDLAILGKETD